MTQTLKTTERLGVVDALRGFALLAIVLLHNLEHYNLFLPLDYTLPAWLQTIDKYAWDTMFFLFAGKAYATFSLLFGFSFYIQFHNAEKRGTDFRGRFAWRMCLLFLFAQKYYIQGIARTKLIVQKRSQGAEFHTKGNTSCPDHFEA